MNVKRTAIKMVVSLLFAPAITYAQKDTTKPKELKEIKLVGKKPIVEHLLDRTVIHTDALVGNAGGSALDVLSNAPGVEVDQNGTISLQGKSGVMVYIDDRPTYLSGQDLANYLNSLPASTIDRIELMTNPPAKYDAAGNAGIIVIRTKRIKERGFNGTATASYTQGKYARTVNSLNLNYRQGKLNISASLGFNDINTFNSSIINRYYDTSIHNFSPVFNQHSTTRRAFDSYSARIGADLYASEKTTFGIVLAGLLNNGTNRTGSTSLFEETNGQLDSTILADNRDDRTFDNGAINLNYRHAYDKKGWEHTIDLDYVTYRTQLNQRFLNTGNDTTLETGNLPSEIHIYSAKTDYTQPLKNGLTIAAGLKSSYTLTDNLADYFNVLQGVSIPDYTQTNHFLYHENINAAYVNANRDFKRLSLQAGLRLENTIAEGHQLGNPQVPDSSFNRNYTGLFPTAYAQYKLDSAGRQQIELNIGRRVDRPNYSQLNPFISPLDKFTFNTGNPYLLPTYSTNVELSYTYKKVTATLYYSYIRNKIDGLVQIVNGYYYNRPGNLDNTYDEGLEIDAEFDLTRWCNLFVYSRLMYQRTVSNFYTGPLDTRGVEWYVRPVLTFTPAKDWTFQLYGNYQTSLVVEQFVDGSREQVNAALSKKFGTKWTLRVVGNDPFYILKTTWRIGYLAGTEANYSNIVDSRNIVFSLTYRFGKAIKDQRKHEGNGAKSEEERAQN
jgi:hypothetical protein